MIRLIKKGFRKFIHAERGIHKAFRHDLSFRLEVLGIIPLIALNLVLWPLESFELIAIILAYGLMLLTELVNTSLEIALNRLHPLKHHLIGMSKDIAAGAVVISILILAAVLLVVILNHI